MCTKTDPFVTRPLRVVLAWMVAFAFAWAPVARAAPTSTTEPANTPPASAPSAAAEPASAPAESGSPIAELERAQAARKANPSAQTWRAEGRAHEQLGDLEGAESAYRAGIGAASEAERAALQTDLDRVVAARRGKAADEPASTHRKELDAKWGGAKGTAKAPKGSSEPLPAQPKNDRIVTKWYFWVTVLAIAASAAAVTGIAIKAARDERKDALDRRFTPPGGAQRWPSGPAVLRF
jgi:hypothetical protein